MAKKSEPEAEVYRCPPDSESVREEQSEAEPRKLYKEGKRDENMRFGLGIASFLASFLACLLGYMFGFVFGCIFRYWFKLPFWLQFGLDLDPVVSQSVGQSDLV